MFIALGRRASTFSFYEDCSNETVFFSGPPGTGKTTTIAAMILQIIFRCKEMYPGSPLPRILLTAPSNAAVDEIVRKLMECRHKLHNADKFNMMRVGKLNVIHPEVKPISLEELKGTWWPMSSLYLTAVCLHFS